MTEREKKTLIEILENLQFIRGNIDCIEYIDDDSRRSHSEYVNDLLNTLSWHIQTNLKEID